MLEDGQGIEEEGDEADVHEAGAGGAVYEVGEGRHEREAPRDRAQRPQHGDEGGELEEVLVREMLPRIDLEDEHVVDAVVPPAEDVEADVGAEERADEAEPVEAHPPVDTQLSVKLTSTIFKFPLQKQKTSFISHSYTLHTSISTCAGYQVSSDAYSTRSTLR